MEKNTDRIDRDELLSAIGPEKKKKNSGKESNTTSLSGESSSSMTNIALSVEEKLPVNNIQKKKLPDIDTIESTEEVEIPSDPMDRVIGQDEAIRMAKIAAIQRRHLLLVGPPGTGKSMIAQALALHLPKPSEEIVVVHNPEYPERPNIEIRKGAEVEAEEKLKMMADGYLIDPREAPKKVAEQLGYLCPNCGAYSSYTEKRCPSCDKPKFIPPKPTTNNPFSDILTGIVEVTVNQLGAGKQKVTTTRKRGDKEEVVVFERAEEKIKVLDEEALSKRREIEKRTPRKTIVPLLRNPFVMATGASETELLGDVRHDPYGGHPQLGTLPYERVVAGAIHEAHEGVLFIDEIPQLGHLQRYILTAMQEHRFPISGRNPQSAGASVRVENVPCNFILVAACNISDLPNIMAPIRSRIIGSGYEILVETTMPDTPENRSKLVQFMAQEVFTDMRIPHLDKGGIMTIIDIARKRAKQLDNKDEALTLRLRELGGLIRTAGDLARMDNSPFITKDHVERGLKFSRTVEEQIKEKYGSYYAGLARDVTAAQKEGISPYNYWEHHINDDKRGYE